MLGADIHDAPRRLPMAVVAERAFTSRSTLQRVEAGDMNVSIGIYAGVLQALGLLNGLSQIADIANDTVGQTLASADLPKHTHLRRPARTSRDGIAFDIARAIKQREQKHDQMKRETTLRIVR